MRGALHERESARDGWSISDDGHFEMIIYLITLFLFPYDLDLGVVHHECVVPQPD